MMTDNDEEQSLEEVILAEDMKEIADELLALLAARNDPRPEVPGIRTEDSEGADFASWRRGWDAARRQAKVETAEAKAEWDQKYEEAKQIEDAEERGAAMAGLFISQEEPTDDDRRRAAEVAEEIRIADEKAEAETLYEKEKLKRRAIRNKAWADGWNASRTFYEKRAADQMRILTEEGMAEEEAFYGGQQYPASGTVERNTPEAHGRKAGMRQ